MLSDGIKLFAYNFNGYWKDVGTIKSLWEANMDLLNPDVPIDLIDSDIRIYSRNYAKPATFFSDKSNVSDSLVAEGCIIKGEIINSVISTGCTIEEGARVNHSVLMPGVVVKRGAVVEYSIIGENSEIGENVGVGISSGDKKKTPEICVVGKNTTLPYGKQKKEGV
jgi:glucose-1-phosphate adenylyltransferase